MLKNYLQIFYRNFLKQKTHTLINVFGLSLGLASAVLMSLYIYDEMKFDRNHPHFDRTYRLGLGTTNKEGQSNTDAVTFGSWARRLKEEVPEVEQTLRIFMVPFPTTIRNDAADKSILTDDRRWVESTFPEVIALTLTKGSKGKFFDQPNSMVLSESAAKDLFGDQEPLGQTLIVNDRSATKGQDMAMTVTGIYQDYPLNSTFRHKYLFNLASLRPYIENYDTFLEKSMFQVYVVVKEGAEFQKVTEFMNAMCADLKKEFGAFVTDVRPVAVEITDLHFDKQAVWDFTGAGSKKYLAILTTIAFLILIIACINYMNLTTAKATLRAKEVGVRKALGSSRKKLISQFMIESSVMSLIALVASFILAALFLPRFNSLASKQFVSADLLQQDIVMIFLGITVFAALVGGAYPAFMISGFKPISALKGMNTSGGGARFLRKSLVTLQYAVALSLTIVAIVIYRQLGLMHDSKLNEQGDQLMMLRFGSAVPYQKFFPLKDDLLKDPEITAVSLGDAFPRLDHYGMPRLKVNIPELTDQSFTWNQLLVDFDFTKAFDLKVMEGRDFNPDNAGDSTNILLNEAAVRSMNKAPNEMIGQVVSMEIYQNSNTPTIVQRKVIGIIQDFPYQNMRKAIEPLILNPNPNLKGFQAGTMVYVKLPKGKIEEKIKFVEAMWKKNLPDTGLQYYFVNGLFGRLYKTEMTISSLSLNFSVLAILIMVFGVFGLASFTAERRTKEIGVRKTHGASVWQIVRLLMINFIEIFLIAALIVVPINYYLLDSWLSTFMYRTPLDGFVFGLSLAVILLITVLTVGYETMKAAMANPVQSLRHD